MVRITSFKCISHFIFLMGMCGAAYSVESATFTTIVQEKVNPEFWDGYFLCISV